MDLRSGETVWHLIDGTPPVHAPLTTDARCDVVIVGGGITGALIAYELTRAGLECVLIDKRAIGGGSTMASTALLSYELDTPLFKLAELIGEAEAADCYRACHDALHGIASVVAELNTNCDFVRRQSYYLAECPDDVADLEREHEIRRRHGLSVELLGRDEIEERFSFTRPAALLTHDSGEIDVVKFVNALIFASRTRGLRVHDRTWMQKREFGTSDIELRTDGGCRISARKVVFATGYESEKYLGRKIGSLKSTYAVATQPIMEFRGWPERCLIWTSARPYLYLRTTADARAVIGGEDIEAADDLARDVLLPAKTERLERELREMFPEMPFELACAWAGTFGETPDSLARIGETAEKPGAFFALGYGGNGILYSRIAAEIIRDACCGRENSMARLFRLDR